MRLHVREGGLALLYAVLDGQLCGLLIFVHETIECGVIILTCYRFFMPSSDVTSRKNSFRGYL